MASRCGYGALVARLPYSDSSLEAGCRGLSRFKHAAITPKLAWEKSRSSSRWPTFPHLCEDQGVDHVWSCHMSRLTIDISEQQHQSLKALAALQGKTIKQYAIERLFPGNVDNDPAWQELRGVLTARINDGLAGKVSSRSIGDILDEELSGESRV